MRATYPSFDPIVRDSEVSMCVSFSSTDIHALTCRHESAVVLLRGILQLLKAKDVLPNGAKGKLCSQEAASDVLVSMLSTYAASSEAENEAQENLPKTPASTRKSRLSFGVTPGTGRTPKSSRRKSIGDSSITSPALKARVINLQNSIEESERGRSPRPVWVVFIGFLQRLSTMEGLERAAYRGPTVSTVCKSLNFLPHSERTHFLRFLIKISRSKIATHRLVASEILGYVVSQNWLCSHLEQISELETIPVGSPPTPTETNQGLPLPHCLWKILQERLTDRAGAVRAKSAAAIERAAEFVPTFMVQDLISAVSKRIYRDPTATTRKSSLLALSGILISNPNEINESHIATFCDVCRDPSLLTRRAAADALTNLLLSPNTNHHSSLLQEAWSTSVLPMVLDEETKSKAVSSIDEVVIKPLLDGQDVGLSWRILGYVGGSCGDRGGSKGSMDALQTAVEILAKQDPDRIFRQLSDCVCRATSQSLKSTSIDIEVVGSWCLLDAMLSDQNNYDRIQTEFEAMDRDISFCASAWEVILAKDRENSSKWARSTLRSCLNVLARLASCLDIELAKSCSDDLLEQLKTFSFSTDTTGQAILSLIALTKRVSRGNCRSHVSSWMKTLYTSCEREISVFLQGSIGDTPMARTSRLPEALYTVGDLSVIGFSPDEGSNKNVTSSADSQTELKGMDFPPSTKLKQLIQMLLSDTLPGASQRTTPAPVRAHAFAVLGKLCLRDQDLAKASLNIFARELHVSEASKSYAVQSNALLVLGDLCVRYTNMADRYLPTMASCLQAGSSEMETNFLGSGSKAGVVRKHALLLLSSLLLQDYIKWRGLLFHRFLVACIDPDEEVSILAEKILSGPLWARFPKLFYNNFVETIFVLNGCTAHPLYLAAANQGTSGSGVAVGFDGVSLTGESRIAQRCQAYDFLLSKLNDEEKLGITAKIAKEVLGSALNSEGDLGDACMGSSNTYSLRRERAWNVLVDSFYILTNKEIKVEKNPMGDDLDDSTMSNPTKQVAVAKSRLLSNVSRRYLVDRVLPIVCGLKSKLQDNQSPLLKEARLYLLDLYQSYKVEVKEFLASDTTLLQELEYDARQAQMVEAQ